MSKEIDDFFDEIIEKVEFLGVSREYIELLKYFYGHAGFHDFVEDERSRVFNVYRSNFEPDYENTENEYTEQVEFIPEKDQLQQLKELVTFPDEEDKIVDHDAFKKHQIQKDKNKNKK